MGGPGSGRKKGSTNKKGTKRITAKNQQNIKDALEKLYAKKKAAGKLTKSFVRYD